MSLRDSLLGIIRFRKQFPGRRMKAGFHIWDYCSTASIFTQPFSGTGEVESRWDDTRTVTWQFSADGLGLTRCPHGQDLPLALDSLLSPELELANRRKCVSWRDVSSFYSDVQGTALAKVCVYLYLWCLTHLEVPRVAHAAHVDTAPAHSPAIFKRNLQEK